MARKLSLLTRRIVYLLIAGAASLAANTLLAETESPAAESPTVIENSFISAGPQPDTQPPVPPSPISQSATEPQQKSRRPIAYKNPFSASSKSPPVDTSLRPGPISRWRH